MKVTYEIPPELIGKTAYTKLGNFTLDDNMSQTDRALLVDNFEYPLIKIETDEQKETQKSEQSGGITEHQEPEFGHVKSENGNHKD